LALNTPPPLFGPQITEPERIGTALQRADVIKGASVCEKETTPMMILFDAVAVLERVEILSGKALDRQMEGGGDLIDLRPGDVDRSGFAHATSAALLTAESKALIKKIGPVLKSS
jgi:hypothetical protein